MTAAVVTQLTQGAKRAQAEGVKVIARGTDKRTGTRFYVVRGSTGTQYTVTILAGRLSCTCPAGVHGKVCKHRSLIHDVLAAELKVSARTEAQRQTMGAATAAATAATMGAATAATTAATTAAAVGDGWSRECPKPLDDRKPVSMWK